MGTPARFLCTGDTNFALHNAPEARSLPSFGAGHDLFFLQGLHPAEPELGCNLPETFEPPWNSSYCGDGKILHFEIWLSEEPSPTPMEAMEVKSLEDYLEGEDYDVPSLPSEDEPQTWVWRMWRMLRTWLMWAWRLLVSLSLGLRHLLGNGDRIECLNAEW